MRIGEILSRLSGPIMFSAAFAMYMVSDSTLNALVDSVRCKLVNSDVYYQAQNDRDVELFDFDSAADGCDFSVDGEYVLAVVGRNVDIKTIIENGRSDSYQKIVIVPGIVNGEACYTTYKKAVSVNAVEQVVPVESGIWHIDGEFPINNIIDTTAKYDVSTQYAATGALESITFKKV